MGSGSFTIRMEACMKGTGIRTRWRGSDDCTISRGSWPTRGSGSVTSSWGKVSCTTSSHNSSRLALTIVILM